ncbi:unnamed protein product [Ectocarpus sp. 12 AP-2014]
MVFWRLLLGTLLIYPVPLHARSRASLFEFVDQVTELSPSTFSDVAASSVPWVLDCYSPGCPHCVRFAPTWERVGTALRDTPVHVGAVNCLKHRELCSSLHVPSYPTLMAINSPGEPGGTTDEPAKKVLKKGTHSFEAVMDLIKGEFAGALENVTVPDAAAVEVVHVKVTGREKDRRVRGQRRASEEGGAGAPCILRIEDAAVSVRFVLRNEVFTQGTSLDEERMGALLSFLDLLATTFPGKMNRASFRSLATDLRQDPSLNDIARWDKRIGNFHIGSFAPGKGDNWPAANIERGTETYVSHYTSGLWSLFHLLSVSEAPMRQNPYAVMEGIASFVDNFFRCEVCRSHFMDMYSTCDNGRCDIPKPANVRGQHTSQGEPALALWVWRAHNTVNARLALEGDEEVGPYEGLWPSAKACKQCWSGFPQGKDKPSWSETEVLKLLKMTFSCPEIAGEGPDASGRSWAVNGVMLCAVVAVLMWARRWTELRGIGLSKKRGDSAPDV